MSISIRQNIKSYPGHTLSEYRNDSSFALIKSDGSVVGWDVDSAYVSTKIDGVIDVTQVYSSSNSFAALRVDGSVVTWGFSAGGNSDSVASLIDGRVDVIDISSTSDAFAALRIDGSVITWGVDANGGNSSTNAIRLNGDIDVTHIFSNTQAFAALRSDGSVVTWGNEVSGGSSKVVDVLNSNLNYSVASKLDGTIDVVNIISTQLAFAALRSDGSVVTWGWNLLGGAGNSYSVSQNVIEIYSTGFAFAALRSDGSVVCWGDKDFGGNASNISSLINGTVDVKQIFSTLTAFAALRIDGSVVTWGYDGGDSSAITSKINGDIDVTQIYSTEDAFAALRIDGSVVTWGHQLNIYNENHGENSTSVSNLINGDIDVTQIYATERAFAALRSDGSVVTWGDPFYGGDSNSVTTLLDGNIDVTEIYSTRNAFCALRTDGSVVTWGGSLGNNIEINNQLTSNIVSGAQIYTNDVFLVDPPQLINTNPFNGASFVSVDANITFTFNMDIQIGRGIIEIHKDKANGKVIETFNAATSSNLSISGHSLIIDPTKSFAYKTHYFVTLASGSIKDLVGNDYQGTTSYDFTTSNTVTTALSTYTLSTKEPNDLTYIGSSDFTGTGNAKNNTIIGGVGNDKLNGVKGVDFLIGGTGNDTYLVDSIKDTIREEINAGTDTVQSSVTFSLTALVNVENLTLIGTKAIKGNGNDLDNTVIGNTAKNIINGGLGNDILTGGNGKDTFLFNTALSSTLNVDTITDFIHGTDKIQLSRSIMNNLSIGVKLNPLDFKLSTEVLDASDLIIYDQNSGALSYDEDGSGSSAAIQIAIIGVVVTSHSIQDN